MEAVGSIIRAVGAVLHASGEERAYSTMRTACHNDEAFARLGKDVAKARERADVAWAAAKGEPLWGRAMRGARQALETERYRVDRHAQSSEDYYAVVRGYSAIHDRLHRALGVHVRDSFKTSAPVAALFHMLFLRAKESVAAQRAFFVGALTARSFPGEAKYALLSVVGAADAANASCVCVAPKSVDVAALARLLAPPKSLALLQARLLRPGAGFSNFAGETITGESLMVLMTEWIDDMRALEQDLEKRVLLPALKPPPRRPPAPRGCCGGSEAVAEPEPATPQVVVARYREPANAMSFEDDHVFDANEVLLREEIGRGRSGLVRRGVYQRDGSDVAVKLVFSEALATLENHEGAPAELASIFSREIAVLRRVAHPNCVAFLGTFGSPELGAHGLVLEYCGGGSLQERLDAPPPGPAVDGAALRLADGVAAGLAHLHAAGIIHRDLKPGNVLLSGSTPKLADFGLAQVSGVSSDFDSAQTVCGTPRWMAPEVLDGKPYTNSADVYSFALILWQILAWKPKPFDYVMNIMAFHVALMSGDRPPLDECRARAAPEGLCALLDRAWAAEASARPGMDAILEDLAAARGEMSPSTPMSPHMRGF